MISEYLETGLEFVHIVKKCHFRSKPRSVVLQKTLRKEKIITQHGLPIKRRTLLAEKKWMRLAQEM